MHQNKKRRKNMNTDSKERYLTPEVTVTLFQAADVITTSDTEFDGEGDPLGL